MILKKVEKDNLVKCLIESSTILASTYNKGTKDLTVTFKNGTQYKYIKVKETDYTRFEVAESNGKVLNSHIKKYEFEKLGSIDTATIHEGINSVKDDHKIGSEEHIKNVMTAFLNQCGDNMEGRFPTDYTKYFDEIQLEIEKYKTI